MLLLSSTSDKIRVTTTAAVNTDVHASWLDNASGTITPGRTNTAITTATTTDVVAPPGASTQRNVRSLTVRNRDASVSQTVTVIHTDGTLAMELIKVTLLAGEALHFQDGAGFIVLMAAGSVKVGSDPVVAITGGTLSGVTATLAAGTASIPPLEFTAGTNVTAVTGGELEYDGLVHYASHVASARGVMGSEQFIFTPAAGYTLTSQTAAQKMFNSPTNGALTVNASTTYQFESIFDLTAMSATSNSFGWALGGTATFTTIKWMSTGNKATLATVLAWQSTFNATAANTAITTATTGTVGAAKIRGVMRINAAGTIIPSVSLQTAAAAVVSAGSFFRCWPVGTNTVASVGNWT